MAAVVVLLQGWESALTRQIEFTGKSGAVYRYTSLEEDRFLPPAGANYVIARLRPEGADLIFAGETDNLAARSWSSQLDAARGKYGEAQVLTRLNVRCAIRLAEQEDLVEEHRPAMNQKNAA